MTETDTVAIHVPSGATVQTESDHREDMKAIRRLALAEKRELREALEDDEPDEDFDDSVVYIPTYEQLKLDDYVYPRDRVQSPPPEYRSSAPTPMPADEMDGPDAPKYVSAQNTPTNSPPRPAPTAHSTPEQTSTYETPNTSLAEAGQPAPPRVTLSRLPVNMKDFDVIRSVLYQKISILITHQVQLRNL